MSICTIWPRKRDLWITIPVNLLQLRFDCTLQERPRWCLHLGNIVCTGAKTELQSRLASRMCARLLQKIGLNVMFKNFSIQNIVASASAGYPVKLREMASEHTQASSYEPELFPGLIYRQTDPKIVFLVFRSGKIVITGARSNTVLFDNFYKFRNTVLIHYRDHFDLTTSSSMYRRSGKRLKTRD